MVKQALLLGALSAALTGAAIGAQSMLGGRVGSMIGAVRTGLFMNAMGGGLAIVVLAGLFLRQGKSALAMPTQALIMLAAAGAMGIFIVSGVSFSLQRAGVTAGLAAIILGQLVISVIADTAGWGGAEPIPLHARRIVGLVVMAAAVYLLLPRD